MDLNSALIVAALVAALVIGLLLMVIWRKGRPFTTQGPVFRASRLSRGHHLLPTQVSVSRTSVVRYTPQWVGKLEETIHVAHIASVRIDTHLVFADVWIETSGGVDPISCYGHRKGDAVRIKELIEQYQSEYFRTPGAPPAAPAADPRLLGSRRPADRS
jgi:hypothetical protein